MAKSLDQKLDALIAVAGLIRSRREEPALAETAS